MGFGDKSNKAKREERDEAAAEAATKAAEDASWDDNDKKNKGKASRAEAKAGAADAKLAKAEEKKLLEKEEEMANSKISGANKKDKSGGPQKMTQAQIARNKAMMAALGGPAKGGYAAPKSSKTETVAQPELRPNPNHIDDSVEASGVDSAIGALSSLAVSGDSTPANKMKYKEYEEMVLPKLKEENPGLKLNQLKERAWKNWERAPENPKNQKA